MHWKNHCQDKELSIAELLDEMETIVASGTKLNLIIGIG